MKKHILLALLLVVTLSVKSQKISWTYTTQTEAWSKGAKLDFNPSLDKSDINIYSDEKLQQIEGFGACFNELGWEALLSLSETEKNKILKNLFSKEGANFTLCRIPLGSNDYSLSYYSYNDVPEDFEMKNFNIDRDRYIMIPYIKAAKKINPDIKIWASPWSPPVWMKVNNHYAMGVSNVKQMLPGMKISNNATAFKMEDRYLSAYGLYFSKFVKAYKEEGIDISRVMVQNEPVYQPHWQSCTWRPDDMAYFVGRFLGPQFKQDSLNTEIWLGTVNSSDPNFMRTVLNNKDAASYIKGIGVQWDAKQSIPTIHSEYPNYPIMQTESECGNGENNWNSAEYTWSLINHYLNNGTNSYMYWNMVLDNSGKSTWGWNQNMMISINKETKEVKYNPEYYLMKHLSHYVLPGAFRLKTTGGKEHLAFINPNGEVILIYVNTDDADKDISVSVNGKIVKIKMKRKSVNTFTWMNK
ncbi:glucosylceramidase [Flavobacterium sp. 1]|uniref:glycoside hydrolase family 30 protein n=1 Tax=Flavobacterium sp. 1 TaxID=2035200 RepID=UPI000C245FD5|nr:glycoside hydrolase family 30 protein [Flavobacterium sp. 1]PJJ08406.1 glucosylceramidase [Flavobacterium sp. 1]